MLLNISGISIPSSYVYAHCAIFISIMLEETLVLILVTLNDIRSKTCDRTGQGSSMWRLRRYLWMPGYQSRLVRMCGLHIFSAFGQKGQGCNDFLA